MNKKEIALLNIEWEVDGAIVKIEISGYVFHLRRCFDADTGYGFYDLYDEDGVTHLGEIHVGWIDFEGDEDEVKDSTNFSNLVDDIFENYIHG